jgi:hypothetical protein
VNGRRLPLFLNGAAALAMLALIGLFGFQAALAPPPTVAALQPPSRELKQAPPEQSVVSLPGQVPSPSPNPSPTPQAASSQTGTGPGATRECYQLTQTPDPQSPPCRQGWDPTRQDNGGATAVGVTRDKIYVTFPCVGGFFERCIDASYLAHFFNTHFEFWGRQLVLLEPWCSTWDTSGGCGSPPGSDNKVADLQKDATTAAHANDAGGGVFASLSYFPLQGNEHYYYDTLASQYHLVSVSSVPNAEPESHYQQYDPYEWSVTPTLDLTEENLGQFLCRTMAGRAPAWARSTAQYTQPAQRSFGIVWSRSPDGSNPDLTPLTNILQGCTTSSTLHVIQFDGSQTGATSVTSQLMQDHVSTVACVCGNSGYTTVLANSADTAGYHPEWIAWPFGFQDTDTQYWQYVDATCSCTSPQWPQGQQNQVIGFSDFNKILPPDEEFWFQAIREGSPGYQYGDNGSDIYDYYRYEELMVLATGIQMAGPHLTPQTFAAALEKYPARDPGHGQAPYYQALVGFTQGHGWIQDFTPVYWNSSAQNYYTNEPRTGSLCYIDDGGVGPGVRFGLNGWPDHQLAFYGGAPCR